MTWTARIAAVVLLSSCGPSQGEIRFAKAQFYLAKMTELEAVALSAGAPDYQVHAIAEPECSVKANEDCVWKLAAQPADESEPTAVIELHRTGENRVMVEVDPDTGTQKQADLLLYRIFNLAKGYLPPPVRLIHKEGSRNN